MPGNVFVAHLLQADCSPDGYRAHFGNLKDPNAAMSAPADLLGHFLRYGLAERRIAPMTPDIAAFEALVRVPIANTDFRVSLLANLATDLCEGLGHPYGSDIIRRWSVIRRLQLLGRRPFLLAGDSHSGQFATAGVRDADWLLPLQISCEAGSAAGLGNPNSH